MDSHSLHKTSPEHSVYVVHHWRWLEAGKDGDASAQHYRELEPSMQIDIMFTSGIAFLIGIAKPVGLLDQVEDDHEREGGIKLAAKQAFLEGFQADRDKQ